MQVLNEILEIIGLLVEIMFHKTTRFLEKVKKKGLQYLRALKWLVAIAIIVPLILLILGIVLRDHALIGWAGIILALATLIFSLMTRPLITLVETIYRFFKKGDDPETLAKRFMSAVTSALISELIITLYFVLIPWETNPGLIVPIIITLMIIVIFLIRAWGKIGGFVRAFAFIIAILVFLVSTASFMLPKTFGELQKSVPALDEKFQKNIKEGNTSLIENKPKPVAVVADSMSSKKSDKKPAQAQKPVREKKSEGFFSKLFHLKKPAEENGNRVFAVPGNVKDAFPSDYAVERGDTIDFQVSGTITVTLEKTLEQPASQKQYKVGPAGVWPEWLTVSDYQSSFFEHQSNKCWNALFRIGNKSEGPYYAINAETTLVAQSSGLIWLRPNSFCIGANNAGTTYLPYRLIELKDTFFVSIQIRPCSKVFRDSIARFIRDSSLAVQKKQQDSLLAAQNAYKIIARKDSLSGWKTIFFDASVPEAFPTNIFVTTGDSIEFQASGQAAVFLMNQDRWGEWHDKEHFQIPPSGTWPLWMTADIYVRGFAENYSRRCWNVSFRVTEDKNHPVLNIGEKAAYYVASTGGDIWLKMNRIIQVAAFNPNLKDSIVGQFIVKIRVVHPPASIDTPGAISPSLSGTQNLYRSDPRLSAQAQRESYINQLQYGDWELVYQGNIAASLSEVYKTNVRYREFDSLSITCTGERMFSCTYGTISTKPCGFRPSWLSSTSVLPVPNSPPFALLIGVGSGYLSLPGGSDHAIFCGETPGGLISILNNVPREWCRDGSGSTTVELKIKKVIQ